MLIKHYVSAFQSRSGCFFPNIWVTQFSAWPLRLSGTLGKVACFKIQKPPSSK